MSTYTSDNNPVIEDEQNVTSQRSDTDFMGSTTTETPSKSTEYKVRSSTILQSSSFESSSFDQNNLHNINHEFQTQHQHDNNDTNFNQTVNINTDANAMSCSCFHNPDSENSNALFSNLTHGVTAYCPQHNHHQQAGDNIELKDMNADLANRISNKSENFDNFNDNNAIYNDDRGINGLTKEQQSRSSIMAVFVGILTAIGGFLYGYDTGIINGLLEMNYVKEHYAGNHVAFTAKETSIITATLSMGTFVGSLCAPITSDRFGRRKSIIGCTCVIFFVGILIQVIKADYGHLCAGRFISGFGVGMISAIIPLYQAEASPKWIRGSIISFYQWAITWGLLVSSAVTQITHKINDARCYRIPIAVQFVWGSMLCVGMYLLPESPRFYVKKDKLDDAIISLSKFRRLPINDESLIEELIEIKASHDYEESFGKSTLLDCFRSSPSRVRQGKRMFTGMALQALQQCSGINFIFYYGVNFFVKTGVNNSYLISFITYAVNVCFTIPGILLVEIIGRRKLIIIGAAGMTVSNYLIAIVGCTTDSLIANKVMVAFVCIFIAFFAATWGPLSWVLVGEMYSLSIRQKAVSITAASNWLVNFVFAYSTPYLIDSGTHTAALGAKIFFIWGSLNLASFIFAYFFIYETKGLMLEEIDELFKVCKSARQSENFKPGLINHDDDASETGLNQHSNSDSLNVNDNKLDINNGNDNDISLNRNISQDVNSHINSIDNTANHNNNSVNSSNPLTFNNFIRNTLTATTADSYDIPGPSVSRHTTNSNAYSNSNYIDGGSNNNNLRYRLNYPLGASIPNSLYTTRSSEEGDGEDNYDYDYDDEEYDVDDDAIYENLHNNHRQGSVTINNLINSSSPINAETAGNSINGNVSGTVSNNVDSDYSYTNQEELMNFIQTLAVDRFGVDGATASASTSPLKEDDVEKNLESEVDDKTKDKET